MAYVITELCTRKGDCVEVCPVDCIVPGPRVDANWPLFYIDPDACIDCAACQSECPFEAIFDENVDAVATVEVDTLVVDQEKRLQSSKRSPARTINMCRALPRHTFRS